jgi:hypothetical protein
MSSFESYAASDIVMVRYEGCELRCSTSAATTASAARRARTSRSSGPRARSRSWTSRTRASCTPSCRSAPRRSGAACRAARSSRWSTTWRARATRRGTRCTGRHRQQPGLRGGDPLRVRLQPRGVRARLGQGAERRGRRQRVRVRRRRQDVKSQQGGQEGRRPRVCKSDSATEVAGCKAPIRLTLRPIRDGENPGKEAMKAEDTPESLNAAGEVNLQARDQRRGPPTRRVRVTRR